MLEVQKYLRDLNLTYKESVTGLEILKQDLAIKYKIHPDLPLVILNYDSIFSPKTNPIVIECRGLVLEIGTWDIVARGFGRFFNYGEAPDITGKFEWDKPFDCFCKEDGSYINYFKYNGEYLMSTRGSWGEEECGFSGKTWKELVLDSIPTEKIEAFGFTETNFIFEFTSLHNKIVRMYPEKSVVLLSMNLNEVDIETGTHEWHPNAVDYIAEKIGCKRPVKYNFKGVDGIIKFLEDQAKADPTFEGVVVQDCNGLRLKMKSLSYCSLHHMKGEGDNMYNVKYIVPLILDCEIEEHIIYFPEIAERVAEVRAKMDEAYDKLWHTWYESQSIIDQRLFAEFVIKETPFNSLLFKARKIAGVHQPTDHTLKELWAGAGQLMLKVLFNK